MVWLCKGSNSVWCGCVRGQTVCGVGCVRGQTVCGICACANCKRADLAIMHKCH